MNLLETIANPELPVFQPYKVPDDGIANGERAARAERAAEYYKLILLKERGEFCDETITDLISDLLHLAHRHSYDCRDIAANAVINFRNETTHP